jgi:hypothetical protein
MLTILMRSNATDDHPLSTEVATTRAAQHLREFVTATMRRPDYGLAAVVLAFWVMPLRVWASHLPCTYVPPAVPPAVCY